MDLTEAARTENIVALCDVDEKRATANFERFDRTPKYKDFRVMLDKEGNTIDACTIGIAGHIHRRWLWPACSAGEVHVSASPGTHPTGLQDPPPESAVPHSLDFDLWLGGAARERPGGPAEAREPAPAGPGVPVFGPGNTTPTERGILTGNGAVFVGTKGLMATVNRGEGVRLQAPMGYEKSTLHQQRRRQ